MVPREPILPQEKPLRLHYVRPLAQITHTFDKLCYFFWRLTITVTTKSAKSLIECHSTVINSLKILFGMIEKEWAPDSWYPFQCDHRPLPKEAWSQTLCFTIFRQELTIAFRHKWHHLQRWWLSLWRSSSSLRLNLAKGCFTFLLQNQQWTCWFSSPRHLIHIHETTIQQVWGDGTLTNSP